MSAANRAKGSRQIAGTRCTDPPLSWSDGLMHTGRHDSDRAEVG